VAILHYKVRIRIPLDREVTVCRTDEECIAACLDGHPEAFRDLVEQHQAALLSYLAGRLGDRERAEEAGQETFVRAYFALGKLNKPESFFSWLLGIANRVMQEQQRADHRQRQVGQLLSERKPDREVANDYALERAVASLSEPYRDVVLLRYYGSRSCAQVAEQLGLPLGTVTKRLSRAYQMLRESLGRGGRQSAEKEVRP